MPNLELIASSDAASRLHVDVRTVHRMVTRGSLHPAVKMPGKRGAFLFTPDEIERAIAALDQAATAGAR